MTDPKSSPSQVDATTLIRRAREAGLIDELLAQAILHLDTFEAAAVPAELDPPDTRHDGGRVGRFVLKEQIGKGGMGEVWRAHDPDLNRTVALKFLQRTSDEDVARFRREAHAVARLSHPNVAQLYEFSDDPPYLAMQFVEGEQIRRPEHLVGAARAVAFAHENGILHRDLKPANILVDREGHPYVLDFGLARPVSAEVTAMTGSGDILGTPWFMSPEQARAERATERSDVYGLGATLYALLTARPPHTGPGAYEVIKSVIEDDPPPPPGDLGLIAMKAMEKDPARRYGSADEFADDLERYFRGDAVRARAPSLAYRLRKRVARSPLGWALSALLVLALVGGAGSTWWTAVAAERAERQKQFGGAVEQARHALEGVPTSEQLRAGRDPEREETLEQAAMRERALAAHLTAAAQLERALAVRHDTAIRNERARVGKALVEIALLGRDYTLARHHAGLLGEYGEDPAPALEQIEADQQEQLRRRADRLRQMIEDVQGGLDRDGRALGAPLLEDYVIEASGYRDAQTVEILREVLEPYSDRPVWTEPERQLMALAGRVLARLRLPAAEEFAAELARRGLDLESLGGPYLLKRWQEYAIEAAGFGDEQTVRIVREALAPHLKRAAWREQERDLIRWGLMVLGRVGAYGAVEALAEAMELLKDEQLAAACGIALCNTRDPAAFDPLMAAWKRLDPESEAWRRIAPWFARVPWPPGAADPVTAREFYERGLLRADRQDLEGAIDDYTRALELRPDFVDAHNDRGNVFLIRGLAEAARGIDPRTSYERATQDYARALELKPDYAKAHNNRGLAHRSRGEEEAARGIDPRSSYQRAIQDFTRALELGPGHADAYNNRGNAYRCRGEAEAARGIDPRSSYEQAIQDFTRAMELKSDHADAHNSRGNAYQSQGEAEAARGIDPRGSYERAIQDFTRALELVPGFATAHNNRGNANLRRGDAETALGIDPSSSYEQAIQDYSRELELRPGDAAAYNNRGLAHVKRGQAEEAWGMDPENSYERAIQDFTRALEFLPGFAAAHSNRGLAHLCRGEAEAAQGTDPRGSYERAIQDYTRALELKPGDVAMHENRGYVRFLLEDFAGAAADWQRAIELNPAIEAALRPWIERTRKMLSEEDY